MPTSSNRWRAAFVAMLAVWVVSVTVLGYLIVDQAITLSYAKVTARESERALAVLTRLLPAMQGRSRRQSLLALMGEQNRTEFIVATDSTVEMNGLLFRFDKAGELRRVTMDRDLHESQP
jgi:hypothetical protein